MTEELRTRLALPRFPRASRYDPRWVIGNVMGPHPLWLMEWLCSELDLPPGARVLDLGCGKALTSIFLAREYDVRVVAADLWITPDENWKRIKDAGCDGSVLPLHVDARDVKFADEYFDAVVSVDAYHYFGTDELYLPYLTRFVRPGGHIGVVVPGLAAEFDDERVPEHLLPYWEPDFWTFHSPDWWRRIWRRAGVVDVELADLLEDGWRDWLRWDEVCAEVSDNEFVVNGARREAEMLRLDAGRNLGFARVVARRRSPRT
jgi:SAM-dependent methyltransferase